MSTVSTEPLRMSVEETKRALRSILDDLCSDAFVVGKKPHYKALWVLQVRERVENFLDLYSQQVALAGSLNDLIKVAVNQGQMALHLTKTFGSLPALPAPREPSAVDLQGE